MGALAVQKDTEMFLGGLSRPDTVQEQLLLERIVRPNAESAYGKRYTFAKIASVRDYQNAAPIIDFSAIQPDIDRIADNEQGLLTTEPVRRFFATSGSTSAAKLIPVTSTFIGDKSRAFGIYWGLLFDAHPEAESGRVVGNFSDSGGGSKLPSGIPVSSEGAYWAMVSAATQKRGKSPLPKFVGQIADADARYYTVARILLEEDVTLIMALNPSTILLLFRKMNAHAESLIADVKAGGLNRAIDVGPEVRAHVEEKYRGNSARALQLRALLASSSFLSAQEVWPRLKLVVSWRSPMQQPYLKLLEPHLGKVPQRDYLLMASEAVMAIPAADRESGGILATPFTFFEFIREEELEYSRPEILLAHQLELGKNYVAIISTTAGLYRYNIGDVVRVSGFRERTPIIEFLHRAGSTCSLTGEKLTEDQVTAAVEDVARSLGVDLEGFTLLPAREGFPRYVMLLEPSGAAEPGRFSGAPLLLDRALAAHNIEYGAKRSSERLDAPEIWIVPAGSYEAARRKRVAAGANEAQIKPTALTRNSKYSDDFRVLERFHARS